MIPALTLLLCCQLAGELAVRLANVPFPGPVVGMLLLFLLLVARAQLLPVVRETTQVLLRNLTLLYVPAGVGIVNHLARLRAEWLAILIAVLLSTALTLAVTVLVFEWVARLTSAGPGPGEERR